MSHFTTERALWEITSGPLQIQAYMADPDAFLARFPLSDAESAMIKEKDVQGLSAMGNSDMLIMLFWIAVSGGFSSLGDYLGRMNAPA
jgi:protocatechuate 4,5-dioxygenase alpha chain